MEMRRRGQLHWKDRLVDPQFLPDGAFGEKFVAQADELAFDLDRIPGDQRRDQIGFIHIGHGNEEVRLFVDQFPIGERIFDVPVDRQDMGKGFGIPVDDSDIMNRGEGSREIVADFAGSGDDDIHRWNPS